MRVSIILPGWNANRNVPIDENIIYDGNSFYLDIMLTFFFILEEHFPGLLQLEVRDSVPSAPSGESQLWTF